MPMQVVELGHSHSVDRALDRVNTQVVACTVEQKTAPLHTWCIFDMQGHIIPKKILCWLNVRIRHINECKKTLDAMERLCAKVF